MMKNSDNNDIELNDYLKGDSDISKQYRVESATQEPSTHLDMKILAAAKAAVSQTEENKNNFIQRPRWAMPVSVAAIITLSVSLVVTMQYEAGKPLISEPELMSSDSLPSAPEEFSRSFSDSEEPASVDSEDRIDADKLLDSPATSTHEKFRADDVKTMMKGNLAEIEQVQAETRAKKAEMSRMRKEVQADSVERQVKQREQKQKIVRVESEQSVTVMESAPQAAALLESDLTEDIATKLSDQHFQELLSIKKLWEEGDHLSARQAYDDFIKRNPGVDEEFVKENLGPDIHQALVKK